MTARHSTYKKKSRWDKASPLDKANSKYQRKINFLNKKITTQTIKLRAFKYITKKHGEVFKKLVDEGIVSKDYLKPYLPRKTDAIKIAKQSSTEQKDKTQW